MEAESANYSVTSMCRVLGVSRSGYYAWKSRPPSARAKANAELATQIAAIHEASRGTYGSPRIHAELRCRGFEVGRNRVARLMAEHGVVARFPRRFRCTTDSNHELPIAENIVDRKFEAKAPNRLWVTDITYVQTAQGWLYLAVILDLFSRRVVGWSMADHMRTELVKNALAMALGNRAVDGELVHHSDRGSQYASSEYQRALAKHGIVCSMSRRGNCLDNAVAESFFGTLKVEMFYGRPIPKTRDVARAAVHEYIEVFYNRERRHSALGYVSPAEFEACHNSAADEEAA